MNLRVNFLMSVVSCSLQFACNSHAPVENQSVLHGQWYASIESCEVNNQETSFTSSFDHIIVDSTWEIINSPMINAFAELDTSTVGAQNQITIRVAEKTPRYYVRNLKSDYGFVYDSAGKSEPGLIRFDSLVSTIKFVTDSSFILSGYQLVRVDTMDTSTWIEVFANNEERDDFSYPDSVYYTYSKELLSLPTSICTLVDKIKGAKLENATLKYNAIKSNGFECRDRSLTFSVRPIPKNTLNYQLKILEKFKREHPNGN